MFEDEKKIWVKFACAALSGSAGSITGRTDEFNAGLDKEDWLDEEDLIEDDCRFAALYADIMVDIFKDKYKGC